MKPKFAQHDLFAVTETPVESDRWTVNNADGTPTNWVLALERYVTGGQPVIIRREMKVYEFNGLWFDNIERANDVRDKLERFAHKLEAKHKAAPSRGEKLRLRQVIDRSRCIGGVAIGIAEGLFLQAQEDFAQTLDGELTEQECDTFWQDISDRPGTEQTWKMSLQAVINAIKGPIRKRQQNET